MIQQRALYRGFSGLMAVLLMVGGLAGCDRSGAKPNAESSDAQDTTQTTAKSPRVASTVPAATDLIIAMGAQDHLVAISTQDKMENPDLQKLPRIGDYFTTDWEMLAKVAPNYILVQSAESRLPAGFMNHCRELQINPVRCKFDTLEDIYTMIDELGGDIDESSKAAALKGRISSDLERLKVPSREGRARVKVLLAIDDACTQVAGPGNYLAELVRWIGAENVGDSLQVAWPKVDREMLMQLRPDFIFFLLPDAKPDAQARARKAVADLTQIPAVANQHVYLLTEWYVIQPGSHVVDLAGEMSNLIRASHPEGWPAPGANAATMPASPPRSPLLDSASKPGRLLLPPPPATSPSGSSGYILPYSPSTQPLDPRALLIPPPPPATSPFASPTTLPRFP